MLGEDTLVLTHGGFKKVQDINIYDELLTRYGTFEPVVELGPWKKVDNAVTLSSGETIYCSDDLLWSASKSSSSDKYDYVESYTDYIYTDEIDTDSYNYLCSDTLEMEGDTSSCVWNAYKMAVVVPDKVPDEVILSNLYTRLAFMSGLIDSQICEISDTDGSYHFYTTYIDLATSIVTLARSIEWGVKFDIIKGIYRVTVYATKYIDLLSIRDEYKDCLTYSPIYRHIRILNNEKVEKSEILGRRVKVNGGSLLIGYSLVPIS